ncbi:MAG: FAD-binding oxidoreductase [Nitrososphaerales archaeon]
MNKEKIISDLKKLVGDENVSTYAEDLFVYSFDSYSIPFLDETIMKCRPDVVVKVKTTQQVSDVLRYANQWKIPVTPRAAGTSLAGGTIPIKGGIVLDLRIMNKIKKIDIENLQVIVEPGVIKAKLNEALKPYGFFFPPDPGSEEYCTIGGMIATNAGGMRAVKYGVTKDYVLGLEVVLPNGDVIRTGANTLKYSIGYDLAKLFVGSEGTLGVITEATLKIVPLPKHRAVALAQYRSFRDATKTVPHLIARALPSAIEFLDKYAIKAVNEWTKANIPEEVATLLIEVDGEKEDVRLRMNEVVKTCREFGAVNVQWSDDPNEMIKLWTARRDSGPALLRLRPEWAKMYGAEDVAVPLSKLPDAVEAFQKIGEKYGIFLACIGHAGDGNIHTSISIDVTRKEEQFLAIKRAFEEIHKVALELGGVVAGEHGIGLARKAYMEKQHGNALQVMKAIKQAIDPNNIMNPGKIFD